MTPLSFLPAPVQSFVNGESTDLSRDKVAKLARDQVARNASTEGVAPWSTFFGKGGGFIGCIASFYLLKRGQWKGGILASALTICTMICAQLKIQQWLQSHQEHLRVRFANAASEDEKIRAISRGFQLPQGSAIDLTGMDKLHRYLSLFKGGVSVEITVTLVAPTPTQPPSCTRRSRAYPAMRRRGL